MINYINIIIICVNNNRFKIIKKMNKLIQKEIEKDFHSSEEVEGNKIIIDSYLKEECEEDENEDDILERDKITEEILNNNLSINIPENQTQEEVNKNERKINKDIIEDLFIDLFEYHYKGILGQKRRSPQAKIFSTKYQIEFFYTKLNINFVNFSKYILLILEQKIDDLIEYIKKNFYKNLNIKVILDIKKGLHLVGIDIGKIFEHPFEETRNFDISSILEVLFIYDVLNDNEIDINDEEYEQIIDISKLDEKDNFEKYIEECKIFFEKIENGEREEDDIEVEEEKQDINFQNEDEDKDKEINKNKNMKENMEHKSNSSDEKKEGKNNKEDKEENIINNENITVEELIKYINGSENKKKKKKKRKKKKKTSINNINNINNIDNSEYEEKDEVIKSFKLYITNFSENLEKTQKIKPIISQEFLDKL